MISVGSNKIWFYRHPIDFRRGMNGLILLVADQFQQDPGNGDIYIFRSRKSTAVKILFWHNDGFWCCQKRLETKKFKFPKIEDRQLPLNYNQFHWLLSGMNILQAPAPETPPKRYY